MIRTNYYNFYISEIRYNLFKYIPNVFYPLILKYSYKKLMKKSLNLKKSETLCKMSKAKMLFNKRKQTNEIKQTKI